MILGTGSGAPDESLIVLVETLRSGSGTAPRSPGGALSSTPKPLGHGVEHAYLPRGRHQSMTEQGSPSRASPSRRANSRWLWPGGCGASLHHSQKSTTRSESPPLGLRPPDADEVETLRAGLEGADDGWSDAQHSPRRELDELVVELGPTGARDDEVGLLLLSMPLAEPIPGPPRPDERLRPCAVDGLSRKTRPMKCPVRGRQQTSRRSRVDELARRRSVFNRPYNRRGREAEATTPPAPVIGPGAKRKSAIGNSRRRRKVRCSRRHKEEEQWHQSCRASRSPVRPKTSSRT